MQNHTHGRDSDRNNCKNKIILLRFPMSIIDIDWSTMNHMVSWAMHVCCIAITFEVFAFFRGKSDEITIALVSVV